MPRMGLFDLFKGEKKSTTTTKGSSSKGGSPAGKWASRMEKRAQNYDRQEAIQVLSEMGTSDAVEVLLKRFTYLIDPSITDQEEKDAAFRGIVQAGREAIEPVRAFAAKAESLSLPMRAIQQILERDEYIEELLQWLSKWDTEYAKFVEPKVQILAELEEHSHPAIREGVERFLEDVNESARFHSVGALFKQCDPAAAPALAHLLGDEESLRVRTRIAEGLAAMGWSVPEDEREAVGRGLPPAYSMAGGGKVVKR